MSVPLVPAMEHVCCPLCGADEPQILLRADELSLRDRSRIPWRIVRCRECDLVYVDPRLPSCEEEAIYSGDDYGFRRSQLADAFIDGRPHAERVLDELGAACGRKLLDVGCATGDLLVAAGNRGWSTYGVELSPSAVAVTRRRGPSVQPGTLSGAGYESETFDVVTMLDVIEHLAAPLAELREIHRVLRPGGLIVIETPNWNSVYRRLLQRRWPALMPRLHLIYFQEKTLRRLLAKAGFEVLQAKTEIVSLLSPEAWRRGLSPALLRSVVRESIVRWRLSRPAGRIDALLVRMGPASLGRNGEGSFKELAATWEQDEPPPAAPVSRGASLVRLLNQPLDSFFLKRGMGEQLRLQARKT